MSKILSAIQLADQHCPFVEQGVVDSAYEIIADKKPNYIILLGDLINLHTISTHASQDFIDRYRDPVLRGFISAGEHLRGLKQASEKSKIVYILGNHDKRLVRFVNKNPEWRGMLDDPVKLLRLFGDVPWANEIEVVDLLDDEDDWAPGNCRLSHCHGHFTGKHNASKHIEAYHQSVVYGHCHTIQIHTARRKKHSIAGFAVGHMMTDEGCRYLKGVPQPWARGIGYLYWDDVDGFFTQNLIYAQDDYSFIFEGKKYGVKNGNKKKRKKKSK